jgi:hypothetical protein
MLYIVKVFEGDDVFEYEYGNMDHALEHYEHEKTAKIVQYYKGKEIILRSKAAGKELEV